MYISLNIDVELTEEQKDIIKKQVEEQLKNSITTKQLEEAVKECCKGMIKSIVNESIQTKEYRTYISSKIMRMLTED